MYYLVKVKYTKEFQDGSLKRVTEPFLINGESFTDIEAKVHDEIGSGVRGEFVIMSISKQEIADIFRNDDLETWFKCTATIIDEDEKKYKQTFYLTAQTTKSANEFILDELKNAMINFDVVKVEKTKIVDVF